MAMIHEVCKCETTDIFGGKWGTPAALALFATFGAEQVRSGIFSAWREYNEEYINALQCTGVPGDVEWAKEIGEGVYAELPLGLSTSCPITGGTREDGTYSHLGYEYGLVKVDPETGLEDGAGWVPFANVTYTGPRMDIRSGNPVFSEQQTEIIFAQLAAQEAAGLVIKG